MVKLSNVFNNLYTNYFLIFFRNENIFDESMDDQEKDQQDARARVLGSLPEETRLGKLPCAGLQADSAACPGTVWWAAPSAQPWLTWNSGRSGWSAWSACA